MPAPIALPRGAIERLRHADPALGRVIERVGPCTLSPGDDEGPLSSLARAIVFQQLSGKAAATIYGRFRALFAAEAFPTAGEILAVDEERLRACGLSRQKLAYLRHLCARVAQGDLAPERLLELGDDEVIAQLTQIKGIGRWSAQMFLIFHLGRLDVWPHDDLGVRKGLARVRGLDDLPPMARSRDEGDRYRPYRSVAAWYLWRAAEQPAVP